MEEHIEFLRTAADTNGALLELRAFYAPNSARPPAHFHPHQEEEFQVAQGVIRAAVGGEEATYRAGDMFTVSRGSVHWMHNDGDEFAEVLWRTRPAMRTELLLGRLWKSDRDGEKTKPDPGLLELAVILAEFRDEFRLASPPEPIQGALIGLLGLLGRALGYRPPSSLD